MFIIKSSGRQLRLPKGTGLGVVHPHAIFNPYDPKHYWLFYTPYPPDEAELPYLVRSYNGVDFDDHGVNNPLISRGKKLEWDDHHLADEDVIYTGNVWIMFFAGATYRNHTKIVNVGIALSSNGMNWMKYIRNPVITHGDEWWEKGTGKLIEVSCPTVILLNGKLYVYYATLANDGKYYISLAISKDHYNFIKMGPVIKPKYYWERNGINHPHISLVGDKLLMLYIGDDGKQKHLGLAYAYIDNPTRFYKLDKPLLRASKLFSNPLFDKLRSKNIRILKHANKLIKRNIYSPFWNKLHIYRSSIITYPNKKVFTTRGFQSYLYVSAYDGIFGIPSIGVYNLEFNQESRV